MTEFGNVALIEEREEREGGNVAIRLPGVKKGDMASRVFKPEVNASFNSFYLLQFCRRNILGTSVFVAILPDGSAMGGGNNGRSLSLFLTFWFSFRSMGSTNRHNTTCCPRSG